MACGYTFSPQTLCMLQQGIKLDAPVALQIRVWGQTLAELGNEMAEDSVPILVHEVSLMKWDVQMLTHSLCIAVVFFY